MDEDFSTASGQAERLKRLSAPTASTRTFNPAYSSFIRRMRLILPLIAGIIMAVVFAWGNMSDENIISAENPQAPKTIGKNELLNPRFESIDEKQQPYTITASRALQDESNESLIILEEPVADILLESGNWLAIKAEQGAFRQNNQRLLLQGDVEIFHDQGYQMQMAELHVDMETNAAWAETDVYGQGPAGTLNAKGMKANNNDGQLIFTGPATLVLQSAEGGIDLGGMFGE